MSFSDVLMNIFLQFSEMTTRYKKAKLFKNPEHQNVRLLIQT